MMLHSKKQQGITSVEFAIVGSVFFIVLLGVIEVGRLLFTWNALAEATRRGARVAAVCPPDHSAIRRIAVFDDVSGTGVSPIIFGLTENNILVSYLDVNGALVGDVTVEADYLDIAYVRVEIIGTGTNQFQYQMLIPSLNRTIDAPSFAATIPRESLGVPRLDPAGTPVAAGCFGTPT